MIETLESFHLAPEHWVLAAVCGMLFGLAKTGVVGVGMLAVPIMAGIFGGRLSAGIVLPMLCVADIFGVTYYHKHAEWKYVWRLLPWTITGIFIGLFVGGVVSDTQFKGIIAVIILLSVAIMIWRDIRHRAVAVPNYLWFPAVMGLAGGFATMIGNSAGPLIALYFLSMRLPKNAYIGSIAWFFLIVNLFKIPLHVFFWGTITFQTVLFNSVMIPAIAAGAFIGVRIVKKIPEKPYRVFIIVMITIAAGKMFF